MPFVDQEHSDTPDSEIPGDRCYVEYKKIMEAWNKSPRWTTVDKLVEELFGWEEGERAKFLAFMVFFQLHVIPYELKKREEHGEI